MEDVQAKEKKPNKVRDLCNQLVQASSLEEVEETSKALLRLCARPRRDFLRDYLVAARSVAEKFPEGSKLFQVAQKRYDDLLEQMVEVDIRKAVKTAVEELESDYLRPVTKPVQPVLISFILRKLPDMVELDPDLAIQASAACVRYAEDVDEGRQRLAFAHRRKTIVAIAERESEVARKAFHSLALETCWNYKSAKVAQCEQRLWASLVEDLYRKQPLFGIAAAYDGVWTAEQRESFSSFHARSEGGEIILDYGKKTEETPENEERKKNLHFFKSQAAALAKKLILRFALRYPLQTLSLATDFWACDPSCDITDPPPLRPALAKVLAVNAWCRWATDRPNG